MLNTYAFTFLIPEEFNPDLDAQANGKWSDVSTNFWDKLIANETVPEYVEKLKDFRRRAQEGELDRDPEEQADET